MQVRALQAKSSFSYPREHGALVNAFRLKKKIRLFHEPRLQTAESSWHRKWIHTSEQVADLCRSDNLIRFEIENHILENKLSQQRRPPRDVDHMLYCIQWIIVQIGKELPPVQTVIYMRAELELGFKEIMRLSKGRFYPSVRDDYINFLRKIYNTTEFEYLRHKKI